MIDTEKRPTNRVSLDHWRALAAVVDEGGYAKAAEALGKSQSTVSHSVQRLEQLLQTRVMRIEGRRAVLTEVGRVALRRARYLLQEAADIERQVDTLNAGVEPEVNIAVDAIIPDQVLLPALGRCADQYPDTRIELFETAESGATDLLVAGGVQLAVTPDVPRGWLASRLMDLEMVCVAHPGHPLHALGRPLGERDLGMHRQLLVRESGAAGRPGAAWLSSERRTTFSSMGTRIQALCLGLGYAWCPVLKIGRELEQGLLKPLSFSRAGRRLINLYIVFADEQGAGPATHALANHIEAEAAAVTGRIGTKFVW